MIYFNYTELGSTRKGRKMDVILNITNSVDGGKSHFLNVCARNKQEAEALEKAFRLLKPYIPVLEFSRDSVNEAIMECRLTLGRNPA